MCLTLEQIAIIEEALPQILPAIPCDDYSHEDDVLFGVVLGIIHARGWTQDLSSEERSQFYRYIENLLQQYP